MRSLLSWFFVAAFLLYSATPIRPEAKEVRTSADNASNAGLQHPFGQPPFAQPGYHQHAAYGHPGQPPPGPHGGQPPFMPPGQPGHPPVMPQGQFGQHFPSPFGFHPNPAMGGASSCPSNVVYSCERPAGCQSSDCQVCDCQACAEIGRHFEAENVKEVYIEDSLRMYADLKSKPSPSQTKGTVLFIYPTDDHNGAFAFLRTLCTRLMCWYNQQKNVVMKRVSTVQQATDLLDEYGKDELTDVVLSGHGSPDSLAWGAFTDTALATSLTNSFLNPVYRLQTKMFFSKLREKIKFGGSVMLDACSTAGDKLFGQNFYEYVASHLPGQKVTASQIPLSDDMFQIAREHQGRGGCIAGNMVQFISNGRNVTSQSVGGIAVCKGLEPDKVRALADVNGHCLSECTFTGETARTVLSLVNSSRKDQSRKCKEVSIDWDFNLFKSVDIIGTDRSPPEHNPCYGGRKKVVCQLSHKTQSQRG